jgi:hypothetical protein
MSYLGFMVSGEVLISVVRDGNTNAVDFDALRCCCSKLLMNLPTGLVDLVSSRWELPPGVCQVWS